jgi:hypothetical protein
MARTAAALSIAIGFAGAAHAAPAQLLPGEWETTSSVQMPALPGVPPQVAAMMRAQMGKPTVIRSCITPVEAARGPQTRPPSADCTMEKISYGDGRMVSEMQCRRGGQVSRVKMAGSYTPTSYVMDGRMSAAGGDGGPIAMTMHITGRRISPACSAGAK